MKKEFLTISGIVCLFGMTLSFSGCATFMNSTRQPIRITTIPDQATVTIADAYSKKRIYQGRTPAIVSLRRSAGYFRPRYYRVTITKEGYPKQVVDIEANVSNWYFFGNVAVGGLVGWLVIDPSTGGMWTLSPDEIIIDLDNQRSSRRPDELKVVTLDSLPQTARGHLVPLTHP